MDIFALIAGTLCTISFLPQLIKAINSNFALSRSFLILYLIGVINWGLFGITNTPTNWLLVFISAMQAAFVGLILLKLQVKK